MMMTRIIFLFTFLLGGAAAWLTAIKPLTTSALAATFVIGSNSATMMMESETSAPRTPRVQLTADLLQRKAPLSRINLLKEKERQTTDSPWSLHTRDSLLQAIHAQDKEQLTVIKFHAHYCKTCQRMSIPFKQLSKSYAAVQFIRLEATEDFTSEQLRSLGVTSFPFVQMYRGSDCVASFAGGGPYFRRKLHDTVQECVQRDNWEAFLKENEQTIADHATARSQLVPQTQRMISSC